MARRSRRASHDERCLQQVLGQRQRVEALAFASPTRPRKKRGAVVIRWSDFYARAGVLYKTPQAIRRVVLAYINRRHAAKPNEVKT